MTRANVETGAVLRRELLALAEEDRRTREALAAAGTLWDGYHPDMEAIHRRNAARLAEIIEEMGWPSSSLVGEDGAEAAWRVAQHAIGEPEFQRRCLQALQRAAETSDVPAWQPAMLEDRIRVFEGRLQRYGTQLEPGEDGTPRPCAMEDPDNVDRRRRAVGLEPLAARLAREPPIPLPRDRARFDREYQAWLVRTGWRR
ncbi:MAG: DUF6624 domain-containing protein [Gammaproteobacteria bacterium]